MSIAWTEEQMGAINDYIADVELSEVDKAILLGGAYPYRTHLCHFEYLDIDGWIENTEELTPSDYVDPDLIEELKQDPANQLMFALCILRGPYPQAEHTILRDMQFARLYMMLALIHLRQDNYFTTDKIKEIITTLN